MNSKTITLSGISVALPVILACACWLPVASGQETGPVIGEQVSVRLQIMYDKGLQFLKSTQAVDGSWARAGQYGTYPSMAGLALLCMVASGEDPNYGQYKDNIKKGLDYILSKQNQKTGFFGSQMYDHNYTTLALAELAGFVHDERIGPALEKAVGRIVDSQKINKRGGLYYDPMATSSALGSITGAGIVALMAARNAGVDVPEKTISGLFKLIISYQDSRSGMIGYSGPGDHRTYGPGRSYLGLLCFHLGRRKSHPAARKIGSYVQQISHAMSSTASVFDWYHIFYAPPALFQEDMKLFEKWNNDNITALQKIQAENGSWNFIGGGLTGGGQSSNIVLSTNAALLSLAVNFRLLPIYERQEAITRKEPPSSEKKEPVSP